MPPVVHRDNNWVWLDGSAAEAALRARNCGRDAFNLNPSAMSHPMDTTLPVGCAKPAIRGLSGFDPDPLSYSEASPYPWSARVDQPASSQMQTQHVLEQFHPSPNQPCATVLRNLMRHFSHPPSATAYFPDRETRCLQDCQHHNRPLEKVARPAAEVGVNSFGAGDDTGQLCRSGDLLSRTACNQVITPKRHSSACAQRHYEVTIHLVTLVASQFVPSVGASVDESAGVLCCIA
ncbi:unnamed protein product [Protopolystoma xenopodis]|uniref:Uncharacterized protein n=1 Tax=Protopolystoma xenopodis TaxID=117903 RepID=A0A448XGQ1_9PLAT|nr:unnamed protein product [Protopolystoma xenopodis]